mgnify:CR=1 FL=1
MMSLQSNLKSVKESFNSDEKLLESAFALEIMWKRYRKYIITLLICMVGVGIWWLVSNYIQSQKAIKASAAYERLISDSTDKEALESLKDASPALYDMYRYFNANNDSAVYEALADSQNAFVRSTAQYELASIQASKLLEANDIDESSLNQGLASLERTKPTSLKELAILQEAYLLFKANKVKEAHQKLILIPENSAFYNEAVIFKHFGLDNKFLLGGK